jgi:hypothetical protein
VNSVDSQIIPVKDAQSRSHVAPLILNMSGNGALGDGGIHGGYDPAMDLVGGILQVKEGKDPPGGYVLLQYHGNIRQCVYPGGQSKGHNLCDMFDLVTALFQQTVKVGNEKGIDLKNTGRAPVPVDGFAVGDLLRKRKGRGSQLFHAVGSVGIKIRKSKEPIVINLYLVRWPGIQRKILDLLYFVVHNILLKRVEVESLHIIM